MKKHVSIFNRLIIALCLYLSIGCSIKSMAINTIGETFSEGASVFASDEDPELVRDALPFSLKMMELLLESSPDNSGLLLSACSGFTQYAIAFIASDAEIAELGDYDYAAADSFKLRARQFHVRAREYCLRLVELNYPGVTQRLQLEPVEAVQEFGADDIENMYWLGASWGMAIVLGLDDMSLVADLPVVRALMVRALELDEDYNRGALHGALVTVESVPEILGGSAERAREHFERAVELSEGLDASPFVSLAVGVSLAEQNKQEFRSLLESALAIDPDEEKSIRLLNIVSQRRATFLLDQIDELFGEPLE